VGLLLIDDDSEDREIFRLAVLEINPRLQCTSIMGAEDALDGLRSLAITRPQLIFLDLRMPKMDGFECLLELKADRKLRAIPVIIYAHSDLRNDIRLSLEMGASNYITKPLVFKKICTAVGFFVGLHNLS
jgi:CheY-like chemotaxis protein